MISKSNFYIRVASLIIFLSAVKSPSALDNINPMYNIEVEAVESINEIARTYTAPALWYHHMAMESSSASLLDKIKKAAEKEVLYRMATISLTMECSYSIDSHEAVSCDSKEFSEIQFSECSINLNYKFSVINRSDQMVILKSLLDESFDDIIDQTHVLDSNSVTDIHRMSVFNICQGSIGSEITKKAVAIASSLDSNEGKIPNARAYTKIHKPYVFTNLITRYRYSVANYVLQKV